MANSRIVFILKRIPSMADPSINDVYPGEHFVTEDSGQLYYKDLQGVIVTVGGGKAVVPSSWTYAPSARNFAFNFEGSNFLEALEPFSSSIRFLTNNNTVITAGENTITINITKNGSVVATRDFPIVDIIGRELRVASIPTNAICDVLFDGTKFRVYNTYGFGSNASDGSYYFDNDVAIDGSLTVINDKGKKGFVVLEDGTIVVGNDGVKLTNVTDLFQLKGNSTFDGDVNITGKLNVGNRVYSPKGYDGILLSDVPTLDWTKLTNVLPQDKVPAVSDNSNKIATTKWVADYIAYLGLTGSGEGGNSTVIDTTIQSTVAGEGQTDFDFDYNVGSLLVLSTGHVLVVGEDYTATDGKKIKFTEPCDADEELMFINIGKLDKEKYLTSDQINALITGSNFATTAYVQEQIDALIDGSGDALDTLKELADALNNDPDFATTITNQLAGKADKQHSHAWADITSGVPTATEDTIGLTQFLVASEAIKGTDKTKAMHAVGTKSVVRQFAFDAFKSHTPLSTSAVLTKENIGKWNRYNGSTPGIITLPAASEITENWTIIPIYNFSPHDLTVKIPDAAVGISKIVTTGGGAESIKIPSSASVFFVSELAGSGEKNWNMFGEGTLAYSSGFNKNFSSNGYQVLPSGLIIQWGLASANNITPNLIVSGTQVNWGQSSGSWTWPIAFPNAVLSGVSSVTDGGSPSQWCAIGQMVSMTKSGFTCLVHTNYVPSSAPRIQWLAVGY